jgi:carboxypeptidase C (cathepsin A)
VDPEERGLGFDISQQWSGYLDSGTDTNLFFWMFESRKDPANDPVILWLGGDPGVSSLLGALEQWGPKRMLNNGSFVNNPAAMNEVATIVFLDHLVGTGFSYSTQDTNTHNTRKSSTDVIGFLEAFVRTSFGGKTFSGRELHVGGEYYAGHYVPDIARAIVSRPQEDRFNLKSIMIGNGWVDALTQQKTIHQQLCDAKLTSNLNQMLGDDECNRRFRNLQNCEQSIVECRRDATRCTQLEERCSLSDAPQYNSVRYHDGDGLSEHRFCERRRYNSDDGKAHLKNYLLDARVSLGVDPTKFDGEKWAWKLDHPATLTSFKDSGDYTQNLVPDLGAFLSTAESGVRVLLFAVHIPFPYLSTRNSALTLRTLPNRAQNTSKRPT